MNVTEKVIKKDKRGFSSPNKRTMKVLIFGDSGVGKTSLAERFAYDKSSDYPMTIGVNFMTKRIPIYKGDTELLLIIDVAGQPRFEKVRESFYFGVELFIGVCDLSRKITLENLEKFWIPEILRMNTRNNGGLVQMKLVGNKSDLMNINHLGIIDLEQTAIRITKAHPEIIILNPSVITSVKENLFINEAFGIEGKISNN